ncbi:MAG TPA: DUF6089 family protein [Bacteroidales bacterium]|nr:DUF6089 family protein [Bacteroidales bacterium]
MLKLLQITIFLICFPAFVTLAFTSKNYYLSDPIGCICGSSMTVVEHRNEGELSPFGTITTGFGTAISDLETISYLTYNSIEPKSLAPVAFSDNRIRKTGTENYGMVWDQNMGSIQDDVFFSGAIRRPPQRSLRNQILGLGGREIGFNAGTSHAFTDIQGTKGQNIGNTFDLFLQDPGLALGVYYRVRMVDWFGLSIGVDFATLSGKNTDNLSALYNFSFSNYLLEFNSRIIFFAPLPSITVFDLYGFAGFAMFANFLTLKNQTGSKVEPDEFRLIQFAIPLGIGISRRIGNRFVAGYEIGYRHTAFNMLDGISPRDTRNDAYLFNTLRFGFILNPAR